MPDDLISRETPGVKLGLERSVLLVGPANAGKSTLFQALTGVRARIVNYPGATVDLQEGRWLGTGLGRGWRLLDTPGILALEPRAADEAVTHRLLFSSREIGARVIVLVLEATQLARHLYLALQVRAAGLPYVVALTMTDLLEQQGQALDVESLSSLLGVAVVPVDAARPETLETLALAVSTVTPGESPVSPLPSWDATEVERIRGEADRMAEVVLKRVEGALQDIALARGRLEWLDRWLLHPLWGVLVFFGAMTLVFTAVFWMAQPAMDWVDGLFGRLGQELYAMMPAGPVADFIRDGLVAGFASVVMFVPQIALLFLVLLLLEESGYLARAATMADRPLSLLGLEGRSFVPLLSGFACAIPAMLATRTIPDARTRLLTLTLVPLSSCSARLPVYALLLAYLVPREKPWLAGLGLAALYLGGLLVASVIAVALSRWWPDRRSATLPFVMELPVYRRPNLSRVVRDVIRKVRSYLAKATVPITVVAALLWATTYFPVAGGDPVARLHGSWAAQLGHAMNPLLAPLGVDWRAGVALLAAFAAREVFVASLALALGVTAEGDGLQAGLLSAMSSAHLADGTPMFTMASGIALLVYFIVAMQCASTFVVAWRESGKPLLAVGQLAGFNLLAYALAVLAHFLLS
ncbi:MAG: ferrous iron transporter B [Candidatus Sericytochromatia bacterium]|nr:ferrous iron transporter B [Candidatus Sericytochromatia bacterium]